MKKVLCVILALVMLLSLCACDLSSNQNETPTETKQPTQTPTDAPTEAPTQAPTEAPTECNHNWSNATCTTPKTCSVCAATEGNPADHTWTDATCTTPKTCTVCAATEGGTVPHSWVDATCAAPKTCSVCSATQGSAAGHNMANGKCTVCGNAAFGGNNWEVRWLSPETEEGTGEVLSVLRFETYVLEAPLVEGMLYIADYYANADYDGEPFDQTTHNGKTYYDYGNRDNCGLSVTDNGDTVSVTVVRGMFTESLTLTRSAVDKFTVSASNSEDVPVGTVFTLSE